MLWGWKGIRRSGVWQWPCVTNLVVYYIHLWAQRQGDEKPACYAYAHALIYAKRFVEVSSKRFDKAPYVKYTEIRHL